MISTNQFKNGMTIIVEGLLYSIVEFQHIKPGKGGAFVRTKLKNVKLGRVIDRTFRSGEKFEQAFIESKNIQFLYRSGESYYFLDLETFEQMHLERGQLGHAVDFLKDGLEVTASLYQGELVEITLPVFVELKVEHTEPGFKGNTAKSGGKPAKLESGVTIQVPLFVNNGEVIKIDTRTGEYIARA